MEDEILKRNTDCVYFLASPFTCKKGAECEYRHSNEARLNPRDCWYWLSGNCIDPSCAFRHPPLDAPKEGSTEAAASVPNQPHVPTTKSTVPCYYYYNGFCNKGDRCPFLHEWSDTFVWNFPVKNSVADAPVPPVASKVSAKSDTGAKPAEKLPRSSEMDVISGTGNRLQVQPRQQTQHPAIENAQDQNTSLETYVPGFEGTAAVKPVSSQPSADSFKSDSEPSLGSGQSSEDLIDDTVVRDEWWDSSPGFDVLVDGETQDIASVDDFEYLNPQNLSDGDFDPLFEQYGFVGRTQSDERGFYNNGFYEYPEHLDGELRADQGRFSPRYAGYRNFGQIESRKRKHRSMESPVGGCNDVDLRDHLRRKRMADDYYLDTHDLRHGLLQRRYDRQERLVRDCPSPPRLRGRLASRVERNGVPLPRRTSVAASEQRPRLKKSQHKHYRKYTGMPRHRGSPEGQPRSFFNGEKYAPEFTTAAKPRSLAEIGVNKRQGYQNKLESVEFEGPKPLSEILKVKKKSISSH